MDKDTHSFYETHAKWCVERYEQVALPSLHELLKNYVHRGMTVLEIGAGSGRDAALLTSVGCLVTITDGSQAMLDEAVRLHPELAGRSRVAVFPLDEQDPLLFMRFDLILGLAVVMHLDDHALMLMAQQLARMLHPGGLVVLSHSNGRKDLVADRDQQGRLFYERSHLHMNRFFERNGFFVEYVCESNDGMTRDGLFWITQIMRKVND